MKWPFLLDPVIHICQPSCLESPNIFSNSHYQFGTMGMMCNQRNKNSNWKVNFILLEIDISAHVISVLSYDLFSYLLHTLIVLIFLIKLLISYTNVWIEHGNWMHCLSWLGNTFCISNSIDSIYWNCQELDIINWLIKEQMYLALCSHPRKLSLNSEEKLSYGWCHMLALVRLRTEVSGEPDNSLAIAASI